MTTVSKHFAVKLLTAGSLAWGLCLAMNGADSGLMSGAQRQRLVEALVKAQVLKPERVLVHLSQTCDLVIKGAFYPVLDVRELIPGASFPHGFNQIVVVNEKLDVQQSFRYVSERPLFCAGNELYTLGVSKVNQVDPGGNVLVFDSAKDQPRYKSVDENTLSTRPLQ